MITYSLCFVLFVSLANGLAISNEKDSGERTYHLPDLIEDGPRHTLSSSLEDSKEPGLYPRAKRQAYFGGLQNYNEVNDDDKTPGYFWYDSNNKNEEPQTTYYKMSLGFPLETESAEQEQLQNISEDDVVPIFHYEAETVAPATQEEIPNIDKGNDALDEDSYVQIKDEINKLFSFWDNEGTSAPAIEEAIPSEKEPTSEDEDEKLKYILFYSPEVDKTEPPVTEEVKLSENELEKYSDFLQKFYMSLIIQSMMNDVASAIEDKIADVDTEAITNAESKEPSKMETLYENEWSKSDSNLDPSMYSSSSAIYKPYAYSAIQPLSSSYYNPHPLPIQTPNSPSDVTIVVGDVKIQVSPAGSTRPIPYTYAYI